MTQNKFFILLNVSTKQMIPGSGKYSRELGIEKLREPQTFDKIYLTV